MIVTDSKGRAIEVRRLTMVEQFDLASRIGQPNDSAVWWRMVCEVCAALFLASEEIEATKRQQMVQAIGEALGG